MGSVSLAVSRDAKGDGRFEVNAKSHDGDRATIHVIPGYVLIIDRDRNPAPEMNSVVSLEDSFEAVFQSTVAEDKAQTSERQVTPVIAGNAIDDEGSSGLIQTTPPRRSAEVAANFSGPIDLCVSERLVGAIIPP